VEVGLLGIGLLWQFRTRRYVAAAYWFVAFAIAIFGCGVADLMHKTLGIPYAGTSVFRGLVLAGIFVVWFRTVRTLSIHSITTQRRELFYWATVFATFALGTAVGDFTANALGLGYLASGILFTVLIPMPALACRQFHLDEVVAFWWAYVLTRPLGASFADYFCKAPVHSGVGFGEGPTALVLTATTVGMVVYLSITKKDVQPPLEVAPA